MIAVTMNNSARNVRPPLEGVNRRDHSLARFDEQLVAAQGKASLRVDLRPGREKAFQIVGG